MGPIQTALIVLMVFFSSTAWSEAADDSTPRGKITVLHAASLADLLNEVKTAFERQNPGVEVLLESGTSLSLIRQITDLHKDADVIAVADQSLIPSMLIPSHAEKSTDFLTEQIALIVAQNARHADTITAGNWPEILMKSDVEFGISNPETAPVGYRALMVWQLSERHYKKPGLYRQLHEKLPMKNIRSNAVALMTLLKAGELDYIFDYASLAKQNGLKVILLPPQVSLGDPTFANVYASVSVEVPGKEPGSKTMIKGAPVVYSVASLKNASNPAAAKAFIDFIIGSGGRSLMVDLGMTPLSVASRK